MPITLVQGPKRATNSAGTTLNLTLDDTPINGNVLILTFVTCSAGTYNWHIDSIVQTGVTWTLQKIYDYGACSEIWAGVIGSGASKNIAVNVTDGSTNNGSAVVDACEYSGLDTASLLDKTQQNWENNTIHSTGTTATTTVDDELWIGLCGQYNGSSFTSGTPQNGFTLRDGVYYLENSNTYGVTNCYLEKIVSAKAGAQTGVTTSETVGSTNCIATFKGSGTGSALFRTVAELLGGKEVCSRIHTIGNIPPTPPATGETLVLTNANGTLWCKPIKWSETQECTPAIRPLPLASSEYLDTDTYVLRPRTLEFVIRLSDREKKTFELIYNYASITGTNQYTDIYLYYDYGESDAYIWHYTAWLSDKSYKWEYSKEAGRYVRWWYVTIKCDISNFYGTSNTEPSYPLSTVTIDGHTLDFVLEYERTDKHPPMKPNWINQAEAVDSYLWNECVLDVAYTYRATNDEKYLMDITLRNHTKVVYEDYIHNLFSIAGAGNGIWVSSIEAQWDDTNWEKPWKITVAIQANNSEIESRTANLEVDSLAYPSGTNHLGILYLDELPNPQGLPSSQSVDVGVHIFYFLLPSQALSFHDWQLTGDVTVLEEYTFNRESILTVLVTGDCIIFPRYNMATISGITFDSYLDGNPCVHSIGTMFVDSQGDDVYTEKIINGGFEDDFVGWTIAQGNPNISTDKHHSGAKSAEITNGDEIDQSFVSGIPVSRIQSFGLWYSTFSSFYSGLMGITINYTDYTYTNLSTMEGYFIPVLDWTYFDMLPYLDSGKTISYIQIGNGSSVSLYLDDISLISSDGYSLPHVENITIGNSHDIEYISDPTHDYIFDHWLASSNITVTDTHANPTTFTVNSGTSGTIYAIFIEEDFQIDLSTNIDNPCHNPTITVGGVEYTSPNTIYEFIGAYSTSAAASSGDVNHEFDYWETTGDVTVDDIYANPTTVHVNGNGELIANFRQVTITFQSKHLTDEEDINQGKIKQWVWLGYWYAEPDNDPLPVTSDWALDPYFDLQIEWDPKTSGKVFDHWEVTGNLVLEYASTVNINHVQINGSGTLTAVYKDA